MKNHKIKTQIFYLDRLFKILSDGYNSSYVTFYLKSELRDFPNPIYNVHEENKKLINTIDLKNLVNNLFEQFYNHCKLYNSAPKVFSQDWNNEFILKTIEETTKNILEYIIRNSKEIKTYFLIAEDHYQVIEFCNEQYKRKEIIEFKTEFH